MAIEAVHRGALPRETVLPNQRQPTELPDSLDLLVTDESLDALGRLFSLMSASNAASADGQEESVEFAAKEKEQEIREMISQLKAALKERESKGFWSDLGSVLGKVAAVAGIVASAAVTAVSFGAAAPIAAMAIAGCVLSLAAAVESEFHVLEKCGVDPKIAQWVAVGCAVLGAVCSLGAGVLASGGTAAKLASDATKYTAEAGKWGNVIAGAAAVGAGGSKMAIAVIERNAKEHEIDAYKAQMNAEKFQRLVLQLLEELEDTVEKDTACTKRMVNIIETQSATTAAVAAGGMA